MDPQIPCDPFYVPVASIAEAKKLLSVLADYDIFQLKNHIKPDYCNAGGLQVFSEYDDDEWVDWEDENGCSIDEVDENGEEL